MAALVDTNVLVYRFDPRFPEKQRIATELLGRGISEDSVRVRHEAVVEFVAVVTRPLLDGRPLLSPAEARREAEEFLEVLDLDVEDLSATLGALASSCRLLLLRTLLAGPATSQRLHETLEAPSAGQFYHHLNELQAAGIVSQPRRGTYELAGHRLVPLLVILAAAADLRSGQPQGVGDNEEDRP